MSHKNQIIITWQSCALGVGVYSTKLTCAVYASQLTFFAYHSCNALNAVH